MKKKFILLLFFLAATGHLSYAQKVHKKEMPAEGIIQLTDEVQIPKSSAGYTLWLPKSEPEGLVVYMAARWDTSQESDLVRYAREEQLAVMYVSTYNPLTLLFEASEMQLVEDFIQEVVDKYAIPSDNLLFSGMSIGGTRALRMAMYAQTQESKHQLVPKAIAICDAPLDMVRFHNEMQRTIRINYHPVAANEARWVKGYLEKQLGGSPTENLEAYVDYSPYCHAAEDGNNLVHFEDIAVRTYSEPDVKWWMENRGNDYYSMNVIDLAGLINELKLLGNQEAGLVLTSDKGYREDGTRHPHTWNIVDKKELIKWFSRLR